MTLGIRDYKTVITLGDLKLKIYRSLKNRTVLLNVCEDAIKYLKESDSENYYFKDVLIESLDAVERLKSYIVQVDNPLKGSEFTHLVMCTLETYTVPLQINGSEVDKVSWMETMISKFIDLFEGVQLQGDEEFQYLIRQLQLEITTTYNHSFTEEMQKYVTNYDKFLNLLEKLGIAEPRINNLIKAEVFSKKQG